MVQQRDGGRGRGRRRDRDEPQDDIIEKVVSVSRVAKVVKGGRRFSFTSVVVVGDGNGRVGHRHRPRQRSPRRDPQGFDHRATRNDSPCRSAMAPSRIQSPRASAPLRCCSSRPRRGTGVIAGGGVRAVLEAVGLRNVLTKSLGSNNVVNVVQATRRALMELRDPVQVRRERLRLAGRLPDEPIDEPAIEPAEAVEAGAELAAARDERVTSHDRAQDHLHEIGHRIPIRPGPHYPSLGLRKLGQSTVKDDTPDVRGMLKKVSPPRHRDRN